jgi:hypothetical protein
MQISTVNDFLFVFSFLLPWKKPRCDSSGCGWKENRIIKQTRKYQTISDVLLLKMKLFSTAPRSHEIGRGFVFII